MIQKSTAITYVRRRPSLKKYIVERYHEAIYSLGGRLHPKQAHDATPGKGGNWGGAICFLEHMVQPTSRHALPWALLR